ncbi:bifunctional diaminohydroxyphosphoribosylaminopyrimidine deaminase/5-amino-6-(5-phosphoribosylamino)uracil reductase RibD [Rhodobaculum claviforme]|uniref:Riboflavin biosynthesis protein RibD n=1 Tax=Rhodobaculum claviforme TaxID=1549854 RepID=A0A934TNA1_9RHOB|nr:bifunctional diaminohydroxyphosphoribosylaminopyrimidine deaminase/5-amino-6-(5-phosphoribosylamino)uracil reductase RibD [Rhodobaculum claviforme]MBK5928853.1 riboflavin biosynthesis protein RibD [Rhodobaculum claviforme]
MPAGGDASAQDARWMRVALGLAARGLGRVWPNPAVGCVIVNRGRVVGRGWTQPGGRPHAEAEALARAGSAARGATAYVSLEPCAHHGRTPPCADALVAAGLARVVTPFDDPDPRVCGRGHAVLRAAGVDVTTGVETVAAARLQRGFLLRQTVGRPLLALKLAASLDGRIATATGESRWITGPGARARVHALRACHDAVLVGAGTARADDPMLTVRGLGCVPQPVRVVATGDLDLDPGCALGRSARDVPLWLLHDPARTPPARAAEWTATGARLIAVPGMAPAAMLSALGAAGLTRVFCEGGGQLAAALLAADLVDALHLFTAGVALGGDGRAMLGALGVDRLAAAPRLRLLRAEALAGDVLQLWERAPDSLAQGPGAR